MIDTSGKILVVGLGSSGQAVCRALSGKDVVATDIKKADEFESSLLEELETLGCRLILGSHDVGDLRSYRQVILSPGVPLDIPLVVEAKRLGLKVISEIEWAWRQLNCPVVAITGTNGKTTTTELIGEIFKKSGKKVFVGGNIGRPLTEAIINHIELDIAIVEISSFQLDTSPEFTPDTAVLLNIQPDHMDRYTSFDEYIKSKMSLVYKTIETQKSAFVVLNGDDEIISKYHSADNRTFRWSWHDRSAEAFIRKNFIEINLQKPDRRKIYKSVFELSDNHTPGVHNMENMAAAALVGMLWDISGDVIFEVLKSFRPGSHRLQFVGNYRGISFYDDSKATNVAAVVKALESFEGNVWLLLGGKDKGISYDPLIPLVKEKCCGIIAFGEARKKILRCLQGSIENMFDAKNLDEAVSIAINNAKKGDIVLLSPACASFDQYKSYRERGLHFQRLVKDAVHQ